MMPRRVDAGELAVPGAIDLFESAGENLRPGRSRERGAGERQVEHRVSVVAAEFGVEGRYHHRQQPRLRLGAGGVDEEAALLIPWKAEKPLHHSGAVGAVE